MLLLLAAVYSATAQRSKVIRRDSMAICNATYHYFNLDIDKQHQPKTLPFGNIRFVDVRYDSTFIAINWHPPKFSAVFKSKYDLAGGLASNLTRYYNYYYALRRSDTANELVCFIKKFVITPKSEILTHFMQKPNLLDVEDNNINIDIECFFRLGDSLYPAVQLDTSYVAHFLVQQTRFTDAVAQMLEPLKHKLESLNPQTLSKKKGYSQQMVWDHYKERFAIPVLTTNGYKKGIYKNITELKNQAPSVDSFMISSDQMKYNAGNIMQVDPTSLLIKALQKRTTTIYLYNVAGEMINPSDVFAYSDGKVIWIQHGAMYYPLVRTGNGFEFIYIYYYADSNAQTYMLNLLMPLNLETGTSN